MIAGEAGNSRPEVLTVVGPTAVGKTAVSLALARSLGGEIVSADSRQIYRDMDIGTAKPTADEQASVRHHLIDIIDPSETYDAVRFAADAEKAMVDIIARGSTPLVVGGTGFYVASLFQGLFEGPGRDPELRTGLTDRAASEGVRLLHQELTEVDPEAAERIHVNDSFRVIRALEVYLTTGRSLSEWQEEPVRAAAFSARYVILTLSRKRLYERIDRRVDAMMADGLLAEIEALVSRGVLSSDMPAASAVGYRELLPIVERGEGSLTDAVTLIKRNSRRYAKRQMTWLRSIEDAEWFELGDRTPDDAAAAILALLSERGRPAR